MKYCKIANHEMYTLYEDGKVYSEKLGIFLKHRKNRNGYLIVALDKEQLSIHRLVALHFIPNPYAYSQVNHINGNKEDNHVSNLEWCSAQQNMLHALKTNLRKGWIPTSTKQELVNQYLNGKTIAELVKDFPKTHPSTLSGMLRRQAKKDGLEKEWKEESKRKRKIVACKNLEIINAKNY